MGTTSPPPSSRGELTVASVQSLAISEPKKMSEPKKLMLKLSEAEEAELKKLEKKLREISKLESRGVANLDQKQIEKVAQRPLLEGNLIFQKLRSGYSRN